MLRPRSETSHAFNNGSTATIPVVAALTNPNRTIAVYQMLITASAPTNITIQDSSGLVLSETFAHAATKALILDQLNDGDPWFMTSAGLGVQLAQSGSANIGFDCWYLGGPFVSLPPGTGPGTPPFVGTTWNPADELAATLSNSNLTVTSTATQSGVRGAKAESTGKYYWEVTMTTWGSNTCVGIANATAAFTANVSSNTNAGGVLGNGGIYIHATYQGATIAPVAGGNIIGFALDLGTLLLWARQSPTGNWNSSGTANPATGVGGFSVSTLGVPLYPFWQANVTNETATANFGASTFSGAVPSGFTAGWPSS